MALSSGTTLGTFEIIGILGKGGMGEVYLAEQERPLRRRVALKVIKLGMDTEQVKLLGNYVIFLINQSE